MYSPTQGESFTRKVRVAVFSAITTESSLSLSVSLSLSHPALLLTIEALVLLVMGGYFNNWCMLVNTKHQFC